MISPGLRIGRYEVGKRLGKGGFGVVHVARDVDLDREVAIKVLKPEYLARPEIVQRFLQEARAAAKIGHPGIVTVYECGQIQNSGTRADGNAYIAMELLVGQSLAERLLDGGRMTSARAIGITRQLAAALGAAHAAGIVHRDLKPDNVYLVPDAAVHGGERVKVLDFGVAKLIDPGDGVNTHSQMMLGTPKYMSPEQARSAASVDHRSDIYTLGCMLFELLTGRAPFSGDLGDQLIAHQQQPPPSARSIVADVPVALDELIRRMLAKAPADRPQSMTDVVDALADLGEDPDTAVRTPPIDGPRASAEITTVKATRRSLDRRLVLVAIGIAAAVLGALVVYLVARRDEGPRIPAAAARPIEPPAGEVRLPPPTTVEAAIDAAPVDDPASIVLVDCKEKLAGEQWGEAITCAEDLRRYDAAASKRVWDQAHAEQKAEAALRRLQSAVAAKNYQAAAAARDQIGMDSVYRKEANDTYDRLIAEVTLQVLAKAKQLANHCKAYDAAMTRLETAGIPADVIDGVKRDVPCAGRNRTPAPPPELAASCANVDDDIARGQEAFGQGANGVALTHFGRAYACRGEARLLQLAFAAACKARNVGKARDYWRKMSPGMQQTVAAFCPSNGITLESLNK